MGGSQDHDELGRLLDLGRTLVAELDFEQLLERVLDEARAITGARYAALGILDEARIELERFLTAGVDAAAQHAIGVVPRGRGVLGVLISDPRPLRLADVGRDPRSYGFPEGHPAMRSFLGVPIVIGGHAWGNLYLAEKRDGREFTAADERAATVLAQCAATAIDNSRAYGVSERRRAQLEQAVRGLEAAREIADAGGSATGLDEVLELTVTRARALVGARSVLIVLCERDELVVAARAGDHAGSVGERLSLPGSALSVVLERERSGRIAELGAELRIVAGELGAGDAHAALLVPICHAGKRLGVLAAFDRGENRGAFTEADGELLRTLAASAANVLALRRSVAADRLRGAIAAAEAERRRWARELHDETLQRLASARVLLSSARRRGGAAATERAIRQAIDNVERQIENLQALIKHLRPAALDEHGLVAALQARLESRRDGGVEITSVLALPAP